MRLKINFRWMRSLAYLAIVIGLAIGFWFSRERWLSWLKLDGRTNGAAHTEIQTAEEVRTLKLTDQARINLGLVAKPAMSQTYWRAIEIPGVIMDRPGVTDNGVTTPVVGVVAKIHAFEGDIVEPGQKLFTIRLVSEYLQKSQADLFKSTREIEILRKDINRLRPLADSGAVAGSRIIELQQQISRQEGLIEGLRQDLLSRGLQVTHIAEIESGQFLTTIDIHTPQIAAIDSDFVPVKYARSPVDLFKSGFLEVQSLKVSLGQQVDAGQLLAVLANHNVLYIKGIAFKKEASSLARAAENGWPVEVDFTEESATDWPDVKQEFRIRHMANTVDANSRTLDVFVPLANQSRMYEKDSRPFVLWRYRPGQRVRIKIPIEAMQDVIVLPSAAVVFEGLEAFVFQQNGDMFNRLSVRVVHQDRVSVVIANDGTILPGFYLAQASAASLNRILKSQAATGMRADVHVHADGTTHAAH